MEKISTILIKSKNMKTGFKFFKKLRLVGHYVLYRKQPSAKKSNNRVYYTRKNDPSPQKPDDVGYTLSFDFFGLGYFFCLITSTLKKKIVFA